MEEYFSSSYIDLTKFLKTKGITKGVAKHVIHYVTGMIDKQRPVTFDFMLKMMHILLHHKLIIFTEYDVIYYDEAQDFMAVGLEILKLLPAKHKVISGDICQNIFSSFTYTVDGFKYLNAQITKSFNLTRSYRVNVADAKLVQNFMRTHIKSDIVFEGHNHHDSTIVTTAYITRTNNALIKKMIELDDEGIEFSLARKVGNLFSSVLTLASLKKGNTIMGELSFLNTDVTNYYNDKTVNHKKMSLFKYVLSKHTDNRTIKGAAGLIAKHGSKRMFDLYYTCKRMEKSKKKCALQVGTIHTFKGFSKDRVILDDSLNLDYLNDNKLSDTDKYTESLIRYVAISRHKHKLEFASYNWLADYE